LSNCTIFHKIENFQFRNCFERGALIQTYWKRKHSILSRNVLNFHRHLLQSGQATFTVPFYLHNLFPEVIASAGPFNIRKYSHIRQIKQYPISPRMVFPINDFRECKQKSRERQILKLIQAFQIFCSYCLHFLLVKN
jgi:hypothetical protein